MALFYLNGILLSFVMGSFAQVDLNCDRDPSTVTSCPSGPTTQQTCEDKGCYYCPNHNPPCIEGAGCSTLVDVECKEDGFYRIYGPKACFQEGCSWCGNECKTNPTSADELQPAPICDTQRNTLEYDCRNNPSEILTPNECLQRPYCTWCEDNAAFKCVKDPSLVPTMQPAASCLGNETLHCFSYPNIHITEEDCQNVPGCAFCVNATEEKRCVRSECPPGWKLRKDEKSCCDPTQPPVPPPPNGNEMPWLIEYQAGLTVCAGFVVTSTRVITAATCLTKFDNGTVIPGTVYYGGPADSIIAVAIEVTEAVPFPYHINYIPYHNLMVLKLAEAMPNTAYPLSLPFGEAPPPGVKCYMGTFENSELVEYKVNIKSNEQCILHDEAFEFPFQFCAETPLVSEGSTNFCPGRIGTPIVCQRCESCGMYAYGIKSYEAICDIPFPAYFNKLSPYESFLHDQQIPSSSATFSCPMPAAPPMP